MSKLAVHWQTVPSWANQINTPHHAIIDPGGSNPWPGSKTIGRLWLEEDNQINEKYLAKGAAGADAYFARCLPKFRESPWIWAWQGPNEGQPMSDDNFVKASASFWSRFVDLMHSVGLLVLIGSWGVTWPRIDQIVLFKDALQKADGWATHEYSAPTMQTRTGDFCLHYRQLIAKLKNAGIRVPPLYITETGLDCGCTGQMGKGWKTLGISREQYEAQLAWYDDELSKDPEVKCATVFTGGPKSDWVTFEVDEVLARWIAGRHTTMFPIIGKTFSSLQFADYLKTVKPFVGLKYIVVHHTAIPDASTWIKYTQDYWVNQLQSYYSGQGWTACPHLFISDRGVLVENPLNLNGRGVAGHNTDSVHIETVGNFMQTPPMGPTLDFLVNACASLLKWAGLGIGGLTNHRILQTVYTECPGDAFVATWGEFQSKVNALMSPVIDQSALERFLGDKCQETITPLNPESAFQKFAQPRGWLPAGKGFDASFGGVLYSAQPYRSSNDTTIQYIVWCITGDWGNVKYFIRRN